MRTHRFQIVAGCGLFVCAALLLAAHIHGLQEVRTVALPLVARMPQLERRAAVLREQVELAELHAALQVGSTEEQLHVFALPEEVDLDRLILTFDLLRDTLRAQGALGDISPLTIDAREEGENGLAMHPIRMELVVRADGLQTFLSLVQLTGLVSVGDALSPAERMQLMQQTESENPAGIVALEQFLSADILAYAREPRPYEEQLLRSFSGVGFERTLQSVRQESLLRDARRLFEGRLGQAFAEHSLWPIQDLRVREAEVRPGAAPDWYRVRVTLVATTRSPRPS